jgi:hypothetical protein
VSVPLLDRPSRRDLKRQRKKKKYRVSQRSLQNWALVVCFFWFAGWQTRGLGFLYNKRQGGKTQAIWRVIPGSLARIESKNSTAVRPSEDSQSPIIIDEVIHRQPMSTQILDHLLPLGPAGGCTRASNRVAGAKYEN